MSVFKTLKTRLRIDLSGKKFGRLTVVRPLGTRHNKVHWLCTCNCGRDNARLVATTVVATGSLQSGHIQSCGCLYTESRGLQTRTHGLSKTPEYRVWKGMIARCENAGREYYPRYGGRGIKVCRAWRESFPQFLADMGPRPTKRHTLERIDNEGNYEPTNCKWATMLEQGQNTSRTKPITFNGRTMSIHAWARELGRGKATIKALADAGKPLDGPLKYALNRGRHRAS